MSKRKFLVPLATLAAAISSNAAENPNLKVGDFFSSEQNATVKSGDITPVNFSFILNPSETATLMAAHYSHRSHSSHSSHSSHRSHQSGF